MILLNGYLSKYKIVLRRETAMKKSGIFRLSLILVIVATLFICASSISFAATSIKNLNYKGGGKVEVTFASKVTYNKPKVTITDNNGNSYKTSITSKTSTLLKFKINNYKTGKSYKVVISGLKSGNAIKSFKIVSRKTAIDIAKRTAKKSPWKATGFTNVEAISTTYKSTAVWKVSFTSNGSAYTYWITQQSGKILRSSREAA